jgi:hypothetical protein
MCRLTRIKPLPTNIPSHNIEHSQRGEFLPSVGARRAQRKTGRGSSECGQSRAKSFC